MDEVTDLEFLKYLELSSPERAEDVDTLKKKISDIENFSGELIGLSTKLTESCESEKKEIGLIIDDLKKGNDEYVKEIEVLKSEKEKYKGKVDAVPAFLDQLSSKYISLCNKMGRADIQEEINQFVNTLGAD